MKLDQAGPIVTGPSDRPLRRADKLGTTTKPRTAGHRLLKNAEVAAEIERRQQRVAPHVEIETGITKACILNRV